MISRMVCSSNTVSSVYNKEEVKRGRKIAGGVVQWSYHVLESPFSTPHYFESTRHVRLPKYHSKQGLPLHLTLLFQWNLQLELYR
jgi:hypothetical protein